MNKHLTLLDYHRQYMEDLADFLSAKRRCGDALVVVTPGGIDVVSKSSRLSITTHTDDGLSLVLSEYRNGIFQGESVFPCTITMEGLYQTAIAGLYS